MTKYKLLPYSPRVMQEAFKLIGTKEITGKLSNPVIMNMAHLLSCEKDYLNDDIPWCGLAHAYVLKKAGYSYPKLFLRALSFVDFGVIAKVPMYGDTLVFSRTGGNHVGFYYAENKTHYLVLGGNQNDSYSFMWIAKSRLLMARRCKWAIGQPISVKQYFIPESVGPEKMS